MDSSPATPEDGLTGHYLFWAIPIACLAARRYQQSVAGSIIQPTGKSPAKLTQVNNMNKPIGKVPDTVPAGIADQVFVGEVSKRIRRETAGSITSMASTSGSSHDANVLIHNVSHSDVVLSLNTLDMLLEECNVMARPKFSCFYSVHQAVYDKLKNAEQAGGGAAIIYHPVYAELSSQEPISTLEPRSNPGSGFRVDDNTGSVNFGAGFDLLGLRCTVDDLSNLRFRGSDQDKLQNSRAVLISRIYFPLLAILMPQWLENVNSSTHSEKTVLLISGQGTPLDARAEDHDNSTFYLAKLMRMLISRMYPDINVKIVHSGASNLFRYDDNIKFVKGELAGHIEEMRDKMVRLSKDKWKDHFKITVSFADGSSARVSAINAAMRQYRPRYMHFWQLKSFWHAAKLCLEDIESHSFEEISTVPPVAVKEIADSVSVDSLVDLVASEMKAFRASFDDLRGQENDLRSFWLRKTGKLVMAVLLVIKPDGTRRMYRGTNMEVSMPTGSLCAERNVIGTALSSDLSICRQDLRMIAVLSVDMSKNNEPSQSSMWSQIQPLITPTGSVAHAAVPTRKQFAFGNADVDIEAPVSSEEVFERNQDAVPEAIGAPSTPPSQMIRVYSNLQTPSPDRRKGGEGHSFYDFPDSLELPPSIASDRSTDVSNGTIGNVNVKPRSPSILKVTTSQSAPPPPPPCLSKQRSRMSVEHKNGDMNPLKPCGACLEWLRKIAEVNPRFSVLTFANAECKAVYVEEVEAMMY